MVLLEKLMVYNGILMETIGISVMVSIGLLLFFLAGHALHRQEILKAAPDKKCSASEILLREA